MEAAVTEAAPAAHIAAAGGASAAVDEPPPAVLPPALPQPAVLSPAVPSPLAPAAVGDCPVCLNPFNDVVVRLCLPSLVTRLGRGRIATIIAIACCKGGSTHFLRPRFKPLPTPAGAPLRPPPVHDVRADPRCAGAAAADARQVP